MATRKLRDRILFSKPVQGLINWMKIHSLPGFQGIPIFNVGAFVVRELKRENLIIRANAMAFSFYLAIFPSILVLLALLPYLPIENFVETMKESVLQVLPDQAADYIVELIDSMTSEAQTGVLSLGIFLTVLFASNGMMSMLRGFEKNYKVTFEARTGLKRRWLALQLIVILGGIFVSSVFLIVFGRTLLDSLANWIDITNHRLYLILVLRWVVILLMFYAGISIVYRFGSPFKSKIKFITSGATFATVMSILTSIAFSYYINKFGQFNKLYGSIGALIILMIWMQINSIIILIGYELNAAIQVNKDLAVQVKSPSEIDADDLK